ncbi:MAG: ABC transporter substrate-binding protein [Hydrogenophaga sp.]|nr:hypothetical protein [Comamonadaceae bacterium]
MKLLLLYCRRWWMIYLPILLTLCMLLAIVTWVWKPLPPKRLVIGAGPAPSSYFLLAQQYAQRLGAMGIEVQVVPHPRPQDPLGKLTAGAQGVDATFAQGLYAQEAPHALALAVIGHELVWLFGRDGMTHPGQWRGRRVAASVAGSSNRLMALRLLAHMGVPADEVSFTDHVGSSAVEALSRGEVDAVVHVAAGTSQTAIDLARLDGVQLLTVERSGSLAARDPLLRPVVMPQGAIELRGNIPDRDITALVTPTHLVVRADLHPALQRALLDVALELHAVPGFLERQENYPTQIGSNFPISEVARQHARGSRPWLETILPFGKAQWAALLVQGLLPVFLLGTFLLLRAPSIIEWRVGAALHHFYGELSFIEGDAQAPGAEQTQAREQLLHRLGELERQVLDMEIPDQFAARWYTLREHLAQVAERLTPGSPSSGPLGAAGPAKAAPPPSHG